MTSLEQIFKFLENNKAFIALLSALFSFFFGVYKYIDLQKLKQIDNLFKIRQDIDNFMQKREIKTIMILTDYTAYKFEKFFFGDLVLKNLIIKDEY